MNLLRCTVFAIVSMTAPAFAPAAAAQSLYVNTNNLILRDRPERTYEVLDILQAGSRLKRDSVDKSYDSDKQVTSRFYQVGLFYRREDGRRAYKRGWVEKKYVVADIRQVTAPGADTAALRHSPITLIPYAGDRDHDPNRNNYLQYRYPKYKGGERVFAKQEKRIYHSGARGGCYYLDKHGKRVYVDKKFCG